MAKVKLTAAAKAWVKRPAAKEKVQALASKKKHTFYLSQRASKLIWKSRVDTGVPISRALEDLIIKNLG